MSLFERLNNKRYDLQEAIDDKGNITPEPGDIAKEKSILRNIKKKQVRLDKNQKKIINTNTKAGDKLLQDINKRKSADLTRADAINRAMGTSGSTEGAGGAGGSSGSTRVTGGKPRSTDADLSRMSADDQETYQKIKDTTPKGGIPDWMKQVDKKRKEIQQQPYQKGIKPAFKRAVLTKGKGLRGLASKVVRNPVGTAIAAGIARDSFRMPQLPKAPTVQGGKVGRRTAGQ